MDELSKEQLNELADKWLKGTLTPEERELLDGWYDIEAGEPLHWTGKDHTEEELESRLLAGIRENRTPVRTLRRRRWFIPAAAVLLITLGTATYFYFAEKAKQQTTLANIIRPGGNKAILTLANGKKIILNNLSNGILTNNAGITITKTANGQLTYTIAGATPTDALLAYNTIEVPIGGKYQVILPDGTKVWLDAATKLRYPERFAGTERKVELLTGQAYFEVNYNAKMPFKVATAGPVIEDLGTHFNIMAYPDENAIKTTLLEGSVKISNITGSKILVPGQQAQVTPARIAIANNIDLEDVTAWKDDYFKFNENLESIMNKVARWYNVQIDYQFKPDPNLAFGGKISRTRDIAEVLKIMEYTGKVHFKIEGRRVIVTQ